MRMSENNRKISNIQRGALESAGLGEVAFFLRNARKQIDHAKFALENIDFSRSCELLESAKTRVAEIERLMVEMRVDLERAEMAALSSAEEAEEEEANKK